MNPGSFYWILVAPIDSFPGDGTAQWQPARYTGKAGDSIGETWDFIGRLSADGHHHVDVLQIGEEICRPVNERSSPDSAALADALEKADWSGCPIGNKIMLQGAIDLLRTSEARLKAAEYAARTNYEGWKQEVERNGGSMP